MTNSKNFNSKSNSLEKLEKSKWFIELITFNKQDLIQEKDQSEAKLNDDFLLIPYVIEKTVLLKLISVADNVYDPMSSRQTKLFSELVFQLIKDYPTLNHQSSNTKVIFDNKQYDFDLKLKSGFYFSYL